MNLFFTPPIKATRKGVAILAPYAFRKIEATLFANGIQNVVVSPPEKLQKEIGPETKVVGITAHDPYGLSPVSTKLSLMFGGGKAWTARFFDDLSERILSLKKKKFGFMVIAGGPGIWQMDLKRPDWIDVVFSGEAEIDLPWVIRGLLENSEVPSKVAGQDPKVGMIPTIVRPARYGEVQVTRGCPRGCQFYSITPEMFRPIPIEDVIKEVHVNLSAGQKSIDLVTDDILLYGSHKLGTNHEEVMKLFREVKAADAEQIYSPHISSLAVKDSPETVLELANIAEYDKYPGEIPVVSLESGSTRIHPHYICWAVLHRYPFVVLLFNMKNCLNISMRSRLQTVIILLIVILFLLVSLNTAGYNPDGNSVSHGGSTASGNIGINDSLAYISPNVNHKTPSAGLNGKWSSMLNYTLGKMNASNIPQMARLLPNFNIAGTGKLLNAPLYTSAPAPMGLASYGLRNVSGNIQPYTYTTNSFKGVINISSISEFYAGTSSPYSFSIQFNSVLTGVTIAGIPGYEYWIQNVAFYSSRTHQLTFVDNIWNFSSPNAVINNGTFHSYTGNVVPGVYYYKIGPTYTVSAPFSLTLYLNSTNVGEENAVFFNYSLSNVSGNTGIISSSYDNVLFNSSIPGSTTAAPAFEVSGNTLSGTGAIPLDAELDLGGPGGGSTADFNQINATLNMFYKDPSSRMVPIGSAYDAGSATGETSSGVSAYYEGTTEYLYSGPSFISGLWNITPSSKSGFAEVTGTIDPASAFVMFSTGSVFSNSSAQWAPTGYSGSFITKLMPGIYSMNVMLSYHDPSGAKVLSLTAGHIEALNLINLAVNYSMGLYTPLYATGNAGLVQLSISGGGTVGNPYIIPGYAYLESHGTGSLSTLNSAFSAVNDYLFPEYSGILVTGTTDYAVFSGFSDPGNTPAFQYTISGKLDLFIAQALGMTPANNLGAYFYNSSNIVFTNSTVSDAFPAAIFDGGTYYNVPYVSGLTFWNVTDSLIEDTLICSQGSGVLVYNNANTDAGNYIWNNTFRNAAVISNGSFFGGSPIGLTVESSGNTVFNNLFDTVITVVSIDGPYANIYNEGNVSYHDAFNISRRPASSIMSFEGTTLTGSIIGSTYQGGNFYYNYFGNGSSAYNGSGLGLAFPGQNLFNGSINDGYDYVPLQVYTTTENVSASGLSNGQQTYFDINNAIYGIPYGSTTTLFLPNGTYQILGFILLNSQEEFVPSSYMGTQILQSGYFYVHGPVPDIVIKYSLYLNVTVSETGLPPGTVWGFAIPLAGEGFTLNANSESLFLESGLEYEIIPQDVLGYYSNSIYTFVVNSVAMDIVIAYYPTGLPTSYSVTFHESGLPGGTLWHVYIDSQEFNSTSSTMTILGIPDGTYNYSVSKISGYQEIQGSQFTIDRSNVTVVLTFTSTSGSASLFYLIMVGVAGLAAGAVISYVMLNRRHGIT